MKKVSKTLLLLGLVLVLLSAMLIGSGAYGMMNQQKIDEEAAIVAQEKADAKAAKAAADLKAKLEKSAAANVAGVQSAVKALVDRQMKPIRDAAAAEIAAAEAAAAKAAAEAAAAIEAAGTQVAVLAEGDDLTVGLMANNSASVQGKNEFTGDVTVNLNLVDGKVQTADYTVVTVPAETNEPAAEVASPTDVAAPVNPTADGDAVEAGSEEPTGRVPFEPSAFGKSAAKNRALLLGMGIVFALFGLLLLYWSTLSGRNPQRFDNWMHSARKTGTFMKKNSMTVALVVVFLLFCYLTEGKLILPQNMSNLLLQNGYVLVMACGMLLCILTGGNIDLSVGSVICLSGGTAAVLIANKGWDAYSTIALCLGIGLAVGIWQGYWIGYVRIPPFITTLAGMFIFRGIGRLILDSKTVALTTYGAGATVTNLFNSYINIPGLDGNWVTEVKRGKEVTQWAYRNIESPFGTIKAVSPLIVGAAIVVLLVLLTIMSRRSKAKHGFTQKSALADFGRTGIIGLVILVYCVMLSQYKGISVMLIWVLAVCLIYNFVTSKTSFGRYFYAVGGNEKATRLSGINTNKVYFLAYANMGLLAGLCGLLCLARVGSVSGATGTSFEMDAIGSCFIGGASAYGGSGTIGGVVIGALLLGVINMGMSIMGITDSWQYVVKGGVLLLAVVFDVLTTRKGGK